MGRSLRFLFLLILVGVFSKALAYGASTESATSERASIEDALSQSWDAGNICNCLSGTCVDESGYPTCEEKFTGPRSIILPRPQYANLALINPSTWIYGCEKNPCDKCFTFLMDYRYSRTYKPERIANELFGSKELIFKGSLVAGRDPKKFEIFADYFGLDPLYQGSLTFEPRIQNHQIDFMMRWELGSWLDYLDCGYLEIQATLAHSRWNLKGKANDGELGDMRESDCGGGDPTPANNYESYMSPDNTTNFTQSLKEAMSGQFVFGDMKTEWNYGRFKLNKEQTDTKLANIDLILGYDFWRCKDCHLGAFLKTVTPTGTKMDKEQAKYRFSSIIGNAHHWEFGAGLSAHWDFWQCDSRCYTIYLDGYITHLFNNRQWRQFGLKHPKYGSLGPNSEYMLLKVFDSSGAYKELMNAVNYTTREVDSYFSAQGEASLRLQYRNCGWNFGLGYNIYGRTQEKFDKTFEIKNPIDNTKYGIKGMTGVAYSDGGIKTLHSTQTDFYADIYGIRFGKGRKYLDPAKSSFNNNQCTDENIDKPGTTPSGTTWDKVAGAYNDAKPQFIDTTYIDYERGRFPRQVIHKLFCQIGYQWQECYDWEPFIAIYGDCDFANKCEMQTPVQWTIGIQGGFSF